MPFVWLLLQIYNLISLVVEGYLKRYIWSLSYLRSITLMYHIIFYLCLVGQRIQFAKTKSDVIAKANGTFVPREKRKQRQDEKGACVLLLFFSFSLINSSVTSHSHTCVSQQTFGIIFASPISLCFRGNCRW